MKTEILYLKQDSNMYRQMFFYLLIELNIHQLVKKVKEARNTMTHQRDKRFANDE
jgi:hypothetical protein